MDSSLSDLDELYLLPMLPKDHQDYGLVTVYDELYHTSYLVIANAQKEIGSISKKELIHNFKFWTLVFMILKEHHESAINLNLSDSIKTDIHHRTMMVENIVNAFSKT